MIDPDVAVVHSRNLPGISSMSDLRGPVGLPSMPLSIALATDHPADSHFLTYYAIDETGKPGYIRANKRSALPRQLRQAGCRLETTCLVLDWDRPKGAHGEHVPWSSAEEAQAFVVALRNAAIPSPSAFYTTRHGARFVHVLTTPVDVERGERLGAGLRETYRAAGIDVDEACKDWSRLYRLPRVVRDGVATWFEPHFILLTGGPPLDPEDCPEGYVEPASEYASIVAVDDELPDPDRCRNLLWEDSPSTNRRRMTAWHKEARRALKAKEWYPQLFEGVQMDLSLGRDNQLTRWIGGTIGALIDKPDASPEKVYALFDEIASQLEPDDGTPDWRLSTWDKVARFWGLEAGKHMLAAADMHRAQEEAEGIEERILRVMRPCYPTHDAINSEDQAAALDAMRGRLIAAAPRGLYVCRRDGTYSDVPVDKTRLASHVRHLGMDGVIETRKVEGWVVKAIPSQELIDRHGITVSRVECSPREAASRIEGEGDRRVLVLRVHRLRRDLLATAREEPAVTEWLRRFAGPQYNRLIEWLSHAPDATRPICSLNLVGASGAGKNMLVNGIAECFENPYACTDEALGKFNLSLLDNPVIHVEEGIPSGQGGRRPDEVLRSLISGGNVPIEPKGQDVRHCRIYPRVVFSSNDLDILRALCGRRDLTDQDIAAIEVRLMHVDVQGDAERWLTARGNSAFTRGWIAGDEPSRHILARHILWLYSRRQPPATGSGRLLVEGDRQSRVLREMSLRTPVARVVVRSLVEMIEHEVRYEGFAVEAANVYAVPHAIVQYWEARLAHLTRGTDLNDRSVGKVLRLVSREEKPKIRRLSSQAAGTPRQRWWHLNLVPLMYEAVSAGYRRNRLDALFVAAHGEGALRDIVEELGGAATEQHEHVS